MRATLAQAIRAEHYGTRTEQLRDWWLDWPCRTGYFWRGLLIERGQGWLRWRTEQRWSDNGYMEPPDPYVAAPPLRRLWWLVRCWLAAPYSMRKHHLSLEEVTCSLSDLDYYRDPDRKRQLWAR